MAKVWEIIQAQATTNLITNPSFEVDTSGWAAGAGYTLTQDASRQFKGVYSTPEPARDHRQPDEIPARLFPLRAAWRGADRGQHD